MISKNSSNSLKHYGIDGMRWGHRRFQNEDGSLTPEGKERYGVNDKIEKAKRSLAKAQLSYIKQQKKQTQMRAKAIKQQNRKAKIEKLKQAGSKIKDTIMNDQYKDYLEKTSKAKMAAQTVLMGPIGAMTYQQMRAHGKGRAGSLAVSGIVRNVGSHPLRIAKMAGKIAGRTVSNRIKQVSARARNARKRRNHMDIDPFFIDRGGFIK